MPEFTFGSRQAANSVRDIGQVAAYLKASDDRRSKTVEIQSSAPDNIIQRLENKAFTTQRRDRESAGKRNLSDSEQQSLKQQHSTFSWQSHGFEAMAAKAALERQGATDWMDFYEPGEGVEGSLANLRDSKQRSAQTGAGIGVGGQRTDEEEMRGRDRMRTQAERMQSEQTKRAKAPAILEQDPEAQEFLREEQAFEGDIWDISFSSGDGPGRVQGSGRDFELLEDRNEQRSARARRLDDMRAAPKTRDPFEWANDPAHYDFPGIDTLEPELVHESRSERAQLVDEQRDAPIAESPEAWAEDPSATDWPGVDTSGSGFLDVPDTQQGSLSGGSAQDTQQAGFDLEADIRDAQGQDSRVDVEQASEFGVDDRGIEAVEGSDSDSGEQGGLERFGGGTRENETLDDLL